MRAVALAMTIFVVMIFSASAQESFEMGWNEGRAVINLEEIQTYIAEQRIEVVGNDRQATAEDFHTVYARLNETFALSFEGERQKLSSCIFDALTLMEETGVDTIGSLPQEDAVWVARVVMLRNEFDGIQRSTEESVAFNAISSLMLLEGLDIETPESRPASLEFANVRSDILQSYASGLGASWERLLNFACTDPELETEIRRYMAERQEFVDLVLQDLEDAIAVMFRDEL